MLLFWCARPLGCDAGGCACVPLVRRDHCPPLVIAMAVLSMSGAQPSPLLKIPLLIATALVVLRVFHHFKWVLVIVVALRACQLAHCGRLFVAQGFCQVGSRNAFVVLVLASRSISARARTGVEPA